MDSNDVMPPFLSVRVFEAAARSSSFARAAEELGITAGAVSQHIRVLEEFAGQPLFRRLGRGVELTEAGQAAFAHASGAMAEMLQAGRAMRASWRGRRISLSTAPSFASKWLIPRLSKFQELFPEIEVRLSADMALVDFSGSDIDFAIRYGPGGYEALHCERLMSESVVVVASPQLLEGRAPLRSAAELAALPLIHDDAAERDPSCPTWSMWFAARGVRREDAERGLRCNQSSLALEAAVAGKGLVLAKRQLALRDIASGALVTPLEETHAPLGFAYWLVWPRGRRFEPAQKAFLDWLREQAIEDDPVADQTA
ncbi:MAG TPA: LysR substrate-binding domain-containing protein [Vitreimonas sp.]|uniref:LysR substrate-binding domain-containing protein n=1 Tax=Vitreimonas sp. TaxID=3069702 RepID=UPI002D2E01B1|nr:LysR substrate-binding domain-containing protein [Vitreimonas sp.]HYD86881.1 LysR substrate-binding domain-containing protein [Vitreimonas sp.]